MARASTCLRQGYPSKVYPSRGLSKQEGSQKIVSKLYLTACAAVETPMRGACNPLDNRSDRQSDRQFRQDRIHKPLGPSSAAWAL